MAGDNPACNYNSIDVPGTAIKAMAMDHRIHWTAYVS